MKRKTGALFVAVVALRFVACQPTFPDAAELKALVGTFRQCGEYACSYIQVNRDHSFTQWGTGEAAVMGRLHGTWHASSGSCLKLQPESPPHNLAKMMSPESLPEAFDWCLRDGETMAVYVDRFSNTPAKTSLKFQRVP